MIYIKRSATPSFFQNIGLRQNQLDEVQEWLSDSARDQRAFPRHPPQFNEFPTVVDELEKEFFSKCVYCERKLAEHERQIAFYRPLAQALQVPERDGGVPDLQNYFWLLWDWSNLHLGCQTCIAVKGSEFPTEQRRVEPEIHHLDRQNAFPYFAEEQPLLVDPSIETPTPHLEFFETGTVRPYAGSKIGQRTIEIHQLDRDGLNTAREAEAEQFVTLWKEAFSLSIATGTDPKLSATLDDIRTACADEKPFAGMKRQLLLRWVDESLTQKRDVPAAFKAALKGGLWQSTIDGIRHLLYPDGIQLRENTNIAYLIGDQSYLSSGSMNGYNQKIVIIHGDVFMGDKIAGDKVAGDKIAGNKIKGDQYVIGSIKGSHIKIGGRSG